MAAGTASRVGVALLLVLVVMGAACTSGRSGDITAAFVSADGRRLELAVDSCNADHTVTTEERGDEVTVTVTVTNDGSEDCQDSVFVRLDDPLGDRTLVDGATGDTLSVEPSDR